MLKYKIPQIVTLIRNNPMSLQEEGDGSRCCP